MGKHFCECLGAFTFSITNASHICWK